VRADDQIVLMNREVAHRRHRQIELKRLPCSAVVERHEDTTLRAGEEQPLSLRIFLDDVDVHAGGQAGRDLLPRLAEVARAIDVRLEVLQLMPVDARIRDIRIEVRRFDARSLGSMR
jgi:hypothetical protein